MPEATRRGHGSALTRKTRARRRIWIHLSSKTHLCLLQMDGTQNSERRPIPSKAHRCRRESLTYLFLQNITRLYYTKK